MSFDGHGPLLADRKVAVGGKAEPEPFTRLTVVFDTVVTELCRKHGMSSATYYAWKAKFGGLEVSDAKRLRSLEEENARLKRLLAETMLDNAGLKDLLSKKW